MLERTVKEHVKKLLKAHDVKQFWPVPSRWGASELDVIGCSRGRSFVIECKRPGEEPTDRQRERLDEWRCAGAETFVIDHPTCAEMLRLKAWLN